MADLTVLDEKLAEVLGLAQAAQLATKRVATLARRERESELIELMGRMGEQARKVQERCESVAEDREGRKRAITTKARETKTEVVEFMRTYLEDAEALDGLEFLSMSEAGELAHWQILETLNERAGDRRIAELVKFSLPLQEQHVEAVASSAHRLAAAEDPAETA